MILPNPRVILNLDEAMVNGSKDKASSDNYSPSDSTLSKSWGGNNPKKGATLTGVKCQREKKKCAFVQYFIIR